MTVSLKGRGLGALVAVVVAVCAMPGVGTANAQGLVNFLWGGDEEFGGKRSVVSFSPKYPAGQVIVSFSDRRLYLVTKPGQALSYPIAVPREQSRWQGVTAVSSKRENPAWTPTPDMFKENPRLPSWVPGGHPMNPLGVRALYLGSSTYRIHGTDAPWTIGQAVSKGCIRMFNEDVLDLYPRVPVGMKVTVTWDKFQTGSAVGQEIAAADASPRSVILKSRPAGAPKSAGGGFASQGGSDEANKDVADETASNDTSAEKKTDATPASASSKGAPKEGFFIYPDEDVKPEAGMVTRYTKKTQSSDASSATQGNKKTAEVH